MLRKVWDDFTYPFLNFNDATGLLDKIIHEADGKTYINKVAVNVHMPF